MELIYFLTCFVQPIFLPTPEAVTLLAGSIALGSFKAFYLGFLGTVGGIITMYLLTKFGTKKLILKLVKEELLEKYSNYVKNNEILITGLLFIIPVLPDEIVCVGAGLTGISFKVFLPIALASKLITSFTFAYSAELVNILPINELELIVLEVIVLLVVVIISKIIKRKRLDDDYEIVK